MFHSMKLKEVRIKVITAKPADVITRGPKGVREVSKFVNTNGKLEYEEIMIVPDDAVVTVEDVE